MSGQALIDAVQHLPTGAELIRQAITGAVGAGGGAAGATGLWAWLSERTKGKAAAPAQMTEAIAAFQSVLNGQAQGLLESFRSDLEALRSRIHELERENGQCRHENGDARRRIDTLEWTLRREGIAIPGWPAPASFPHPTENAA